MILEISVSQFIALFDYDPYKSSPNQNPSLELSFNEGDLIKVYDTSRSDGFYQAEVSIHGLISHNYHLKLISDSFCSLRYEIITKTAGLRSTE